MARYTARENSGNRDSVRYEDILEPVVIDIGNSNNFIEIGCKKAISGKDVNKFVSISKGYYHEKYGKKYKTVVTISLDDEALPTDNRVAIMDALAEAFGLETSI